MLNVLFIEAKPIQVQPVWARQHNSFSQGPILFPTPSSFHSVRSLRPTHTMTDRPRLKSSDTAPLWKQLIMINYMWGQTNTGLSLWRTRLEHIVESF